MSRDTQPGACPSNGASRPPVAIVLLVSLWALGGCARAVAPEGGPVPVTPLRVVASSPDTFATVAPFSGSVDIEFERRASERPARGSLADAVIVSPRTGEVSVELTRSGLRVSMEGGFQASAIYRITVLPVLQDLFRNPMAAPFDLFFSTGPEFEPNVLAGLVTDRLTRGAAPGVRVDAQPYQGGPHQSTIADSTGIFTFPYLPQGRYNLVAYEDQNRNRSPDFMEPQDSLQVDLFPLDTLLIMDLALLLPDSTPARLENVEVLDSVTLRLEFDDPFEPNLLLDQLRVFLTREDGNSPEVIEIHHEHEWAALVAFRAEVEAREAARVSAAEPDSLPPTDPRPPVSADAPDEEPPEEEPPPPLPSRGFVIVLSRPLLPEVTYQVTVEGLVNLNGLPGGGGTRDVEGPPRAEDP